MALAGGPCLLSTANLLTQHSPWARRRAKGSSAPGLVPVSDGPRGCDASAGSACSPLRGRGAGLND